MEQRRLRQQQLQVAREAWEDIQYIDEQRKNRPPYDQRATADDQQRLDRLLPRLAAILNRYQISDNEMNFPPSVPYYTQHMAEWQMHREYVRLDTLARSGELDPAESAQLQVLLAIYRRIYRGDSGMVVGDVPYGEWHKWNVHGF